MAKSKDDKMVEVTVAPRHSIVEKVLRNPDSEKPVYEHVFHGPGKKCLVPAADIDRLRATKFIIDPTVKPISDEEAGKINLGQFLNSGTANAEINTPGSLIVPG